MECSTAIVFSQLSLLPSRLQTETRANPFKSWKERTRQSTRFQCHKIGVRVNPGFRFGEIVLDSDEPVAARLHTPMINDSIFCRFGTSPESTAAQHLHHFFNFIAVKIVAAQLQGYNPEAYEELREFLDRNSLNDGDKFCADLMRESPRHKNLALRILEVRSAYCKDDFEWDNLKRLASKMVDDSNKKLMRDYIVDTSCIADGKQICN